MINDQASQKAIYKDVFVLVTEQKITNNSDILPILQTVFSKGQGQRLLIVGDVSGEALQTLVVNKLQGVVNSVSVSAPIYGDMRSDYLEDIAELTGATLIRNGEKLSEITIVKFGHAESVTVSETSTIIFGGDDATEVIKDRTKQIKTLSEKETNVFKQEKYLDRIAKLSGKIGIIRVGGSTEAEAKESKYRVDDAVNATQAARAEGIVAGGGVCLANLKVNTIPESDCEGYFLTLEAIREPFKELMNSAGDNGGYRLKQIQYTKGMGFDLKNMTETPIDMKLSGIIDPVKVIRMVVENACSIAASIITTNTVITFAEKEKNE